MRFISVHLSVEFTTVTDALNICVCVCMCNSTVWIKFHSIHLKHFPRDSSAVLHIYICELFL